MGMSVLNQALLLLASSVQEQSVAAHGSVFSKAVSLEPVLQHLSAVSGHICSAANCADLDMFVLQQSVLPLDQDRSVLQQFVLPLDVSVRSLSCPWKCLFTAGCAALDMLVLHQLLSLDMSVFLLEPVKGDLSLETISSF
jgi:hypothetical protein